MPTEQMTAATSSGRPPGERCCVALPEWIRDEDGVDAFTADLALLAHPVRLRLLSILARSSEPVCVCDLEAVLPVKQPTVSHHLRLLRSAGLVRAERRGLWTYYEVREAGMRALLDRVGRGLGRLRPSHHEE